MLANLVNIVNKVMNPILAQPAQRVSVPVITENPFASTPSATMVRRNSFAGNYGKNIPVSGGYFAGYVNGKPNIVGRKLFVNV